MTKVEEWLKEDKLVLLEGWARDGLTEEQIANNMGITRPTLWKWKKKEINIFNALKKGKEVTDYEVENALYQNAINGNVTAQIFWLKNRKKNQWREKVEVENTNTKNGVMEDLVEALKNVKKD